MPALGHWDRIVASASLIGTRLAAERCTVGIAKYLLAGNALVVFLVLESKWIDIVTMIKIGFSASADHLSGALP